MPGSDSRPRLTAARRRVLDRLLAELLDCSPAARARRCNELETSHPRLSRWLRPLLEASIEATMETPAVFERLGSRALDSLEVERDRLAPGTRLGPWRIVELSGLGGMGLVYKGKRDDGLFELDVAIKVMRTRDPGFRERIASETRMLARLDHPGIARVLDGGETAEGLPYLVMDWVPGENLDTRVQRDRPSCITCLDLFEQVADAVAHAHKRLIVHADIKPANVRVLPDGRTRLLDFGVARLIAEGDSSARGALALTPSFAAPEQLDGEPATTQTDVWALGALLRWMMSADPGWQQQPLRPEQVELPRAREFCTIVDKAMAPDPEQRYSGVPALLEDLFAWRTGFPVSVRRIGVAGRLMLWARRHGVAATLGGLGLVSTIAGVAGLAWQSRIVTAERDVARYEAQRSAMLREQFVMLFRDAARDAEDAAQISARELLAESVDRVDEQLAGDPVARAAVKAMFGELYIAMDDFAAAEPLLREFAESGDVETSPLLRAMALSDLAQIELRRGASAEALDLTAKSLAILDSLPGEHAARHADVLQIRGQAMRGAGRWEEAVGTLEKALTLAAQDVPGRVLARVANNLATTMIYSGRSAEAMPHLETALENWRALDMADSSDALTVMANLAGLLHQQGRIDEAELLYREAIQTRAGRFGDSGALAAAYLNLANLLSMRNQVDQARGFATRGREMIVRFEGEDSINHARALTTQGRVLKIAGEQQRAAEMFQQALQVFESRVGSDHLFTLITRLHQAELLRETSPEQAVASLSEIIEKMNQLGTVSDSHLAPAWCELARAELERGRGEAALAAARQCTDRRQAAFPPDSWYLAEADALRAASELLLGDEIGAEKLHAARARLAETFGAGHPKLRWCDRWIASLQPESRQAAVSTESRPG